MLTGLDRAIELLTSLKNDLIEHNSRIVVAMAIKTIKRERDKTHDRNSSD